MKLLFLYLCVCVCVCVCVCYRLCGPVCWNLVEMLLKPRDIQLQKMKLWSCISVNESEWECWKESDRGWATDRLHKVTRWVLSHPWEYYSHISGGHVYIFSLRTVFSGGSWMFVRRHTSLLSFHATAVKSPLVLTRMSPHSSLSI